MKRIFLIALAAAAAAPGLALAQTDLQIGDKVMVGSLQQTGTVIGIGGYASPGSVLIKVHLDTLSPQFPDVGSWYDERLSRLSKAGGGAAAPAAAAPAAAPAAAAPAAPAAPAAGGGAVVFQ